MTLDEAVEHESNDELEDDLLDDSLLDPYEQNPYAWTYGPSSGILPSSDPRVLSLRDSNTQSQPDQLYGQPLHPQSGPPSTQPSYGQPPPPSGYGQPPLPMSAPEDPDVDGGIAPQQSSEPSKNSEGR